MTTRRQLLALVGGAGAVGVGVASVAGASGSRDDFNYGLTGNVPIEEQIPVDIDFKGCSEVWIVLEAYLQAGDEFIVTICVYNEATGEFDPVEVTVDNDDLETVPGEWGDRPLFKWSVEDDYQIPGKIVAVAIDDGEFVENEHRCADNVPEGGC